MHSMRWTRRFCWFAVLAAAFAGLAAAQPAAAQEVKLNEVLRSLFYAPQYVALRSGAFEQEGLKIAGPKTTWGVQAAVTEVVSGNSNIALMGPEAAGLTQDASPDRRLVNFALLTNGDGGFILSKTAMPNFTIADLKGKTIVTSGKGSTPALVLVDLIKKAGLDPNKDVTIRNIPVSANIIPSYLEPSTNFAQAFEPMVVQAVAENRGYRVASVGALAGPMPYTAFMAPASYIEKNPAIVQAFTNAVYKGLIWTDTHSPAEIAALIAPDFKDVPVATVEAVIAEYKKVKIWAPDPLLRPEGMDQMMGLMVDAGVSEAAVSVRPDRQSELRPKGHSNDQAMSGRERIRGEGLSYTYLTRIGETLALKDLDLTIRDGEFCSIVGPSGCGKSTLLGIISGLLQPTEGQVLLDGVSIRGTHERVGILLQKDHLFEWRTVLQNAELGLEIRGRNTAEARRRAHQLLESYGLAGFENAYPHQLSGGMRQRVALIRTLATDPDVLLLDEPFSALDYQTKLILERDVHRIIREDKKTALLVTHDIEEAVSMSDRVIVLSGRPAQVKNVYDIALTVAAERTPMNSRDAPEFRGYCKSIWEDLDIERRTL